MRLAGKHPTPKKVKIRKTGDGKAAFFFLLPSVAGTLVFFLFPFLDTIRRSFFDTIGNQFTGAANYQSVLRNPSFQLAFSNTARFIGVCIPLLLLASLVLALLMHTIRPGGRRLKTLFLIPMAIPAASLVLFWKLLFDEQGIVNAAVTKLGGEAVDFMGTNAAFWVLVGTYIWKNCGYNMVLWLSGLDGISDSLYEAAAVDGAGSLRSFWHITLPSLIPVTGMVGILSLLNSFKVFREAYLVSGAYPHDSMYLLQHLFNNWFVNMDISRLCAAAVLLCIALLLVIVLFQWLTGRREA